jgi:branched-chain amino acid transport system substrate-binding protein
MSSTFGSRLSVAASLPGFRRGRVEALKVGFLAPLTGDVSAWGLPGLKGCELWVERVNAEGGIRLAGGPARVELVPFDCAYSPGLALKGARRLVEEEGVALLLMLGGDTFPPVKELVAEARVLTSTLLPSDLSPDTEFLIAPSEVHPLYNVTGVEWIAANRPQLRSAAICGPRDALGLPSIATYRAAFEAAGIALVREIFYDAATADPRAIVSSMLSAAPDILCWSTSYEPFVHAFTEEAFGQGFRGQLLSCTCDRYDRLVERTSAELMEGFVFQFPDFDDPALAAAPINFDRPREFYLEYMKRFPGDWSAVSWEYVAVLDLWRQAVEAAGSTEAPAALAAMKSGGEGAHAFGLARWWGRELFGIDNALVGDWPVVVIRGGRARIAEFRSLPDWLSRNGERLKSHMRALGQLWDQRVSPRAPDTEKVPGAFVRMKGAGR